MTNLPKTYHDLRPYAIGFFRIQAGYVPPVMDKDDFTGIPFELTVLKRYLLKRWGGWVAVHYDPYDEPDIVGEIHVVQCKVNVCWDCVRILNHYYKTDTFFYLSWLVDAHCPLCGEWCDGIPF